MAQINGQEIPVLNIRGKEYPTVATRVQVAHQGTLGSGFSMVGNEVINAHERDFLKITIKIGDNQFSGTAEIHWNATGNTADATSPYETAETSALGRALAFAGFIIDTIASADEMQRVTVEAEPPRQVNPAPVKHLPAPASKVPTDAEHCRTLALNELHYDEKQWSDLCKQFSERGKVNFERMKAQLLRDAEQRNGHMVTLHAALAAHPAD